MNASDIDAILAATLEDRTLSAATENHENVLVSDDPRLVLPFCRAFDDLWTALE
ncbi:hypothetical protein KYC5002_06095 [Archangium violaceum]|uniref:hypothetical protein n=1 Tax=Archangium violaceum TaxID=83451 RepID=UPI002B2ACA42|nr:hypothetical protein KYC5002_06095 [Archangium gephyra]